MKANAVARMAAFLSAFAGSGCTGDIGYDGNQLGDGLVSADAIRRLTRNEYDNSLRDLIGDKSRPGYSALPEDATDPFDNNYATQEISAALIGAVETLATNAALAVLADSTRRAALLPCQPTGPSDANCLPQFNRQFGRP